MASSLTQAFNNVLLLMGLVFNALGAGQGGEHRDLPLPSTALLLGAIHPNNRFELRVAGFKGEVKAVLLADLEAFGRQLTRQARDLDELVAALRLREATVEHRKRVAEPVVPAVPDVPDVSEARDMLDVIEYPNEDMDGGMGGLGELGGFGEFADFAEVPAPVPAPVPVVKAEPVVKTEPVVKAEPEPAPVPVPEPGEPLPADLDDLVNNAGDGLDYMTMLGDSEDINANLNDFFNELGVDM